MRWRKLPFVPVEDMIAAWDAYIAENRKEAAGQRHPVPIRAPAEWFRLRVHENYLEEIRIKRRTELERKLEIEKTIHNWNGHAAELVGSIGQQTFDTIFVGSSITETHDAVTISMRTEFQATKAEQSAAIMSALEDKLFPRKSITFLSPRRHSSKRATA